LPIVSADAAQMKQLFQNLIENGVKFQGDAPPTIRITAERDGGNWVISVEDNGIGIEPKNAERVFAVFQRLHAPDECAGTGIGLAICKKIVARHGGRIWVEAGQGAKFCFTLRGVRDDEVDDVKNPESALGDSFVVDQETADG